MKTPNNRIEMDYIFAAMINACARMLAALGVPAEHISYDEFKSFSHCTAQTARK